MKIDQTKSLLVPIDYKPSPHCDERPKDTLIDLIVIHNISLPPNSFGGKHIENFFCGKLDHTEHPFFETIAALKVSPHLFINRHGVITQFVPFNKRAWHAGVSVFRGREKCNDFSIGIELEGTDDLPYEEKQYHMLANVIHLLMKAFLFIQKDHLVGHSDIAPTRKTDPGPAFDWGRLHSLINEFENKN